jgi:predicted Zn-dependent protease
MSDVDKTMFVCNTEGVWASDRRPRVRFMANCVATDGKNTQTGYTAPGYATDSRPSGASAPRTAAATRPVRP